MTTSRTSCARCGEQLVLHATGRPKSYCSAACRVAAGRARRAGNFPVATTSAGVLDQGAEQLPPGTWMTELPGQRAILVRTDDPRHIASTMSRTTSEVGGSDYRLDGFSTADLLYAVAWCFAEQRATLWPVHLGRAIHAELLTRNL